MKQRRESLTQVVLGLLSLVLSHQLVFFLAHAASVHEAALGAGGHPAYWLPFAVSVVLIAGGLGVVAILQIRRLDLIHSAAGPRRWFLLRPGEQ